MAAYTKNYNLKKPDPDDFVDIADLNENADKIDEALGCLALTDADTGERYLLKLRIEGGHPAMEVTKL